MSSQGRPGWYERRVLPYIIDFACGLGPIRRHRAALVPQARGRVLEVGLGTGRNLAYYDRSRFTEIVGLDPGLAMHPLARIRAARAGLELQLVGLSAERIPYPDASFDTVLLTFTLCSIPDPVAALREMRRVLRPGHPLLYCEHGLAPEDSVRRWQDRLTPGWSRLFGGCHLNRDVPALLAQAGLRSLEMQAGYMPGPRPIGYLYRGAASAG